MATLPVSIQQTNLSELVASGNDFELQARAVRDLMMQRAASGDANISHPWDGLTAAGEEREEVPSWQSSELYQHQMNNAVHPRPPAGHSLNDIKIMVSGPETQPASS